MTASYLISLGKTNKQKHESSCVEETQLFQKLILICKFSSTSTVLIGMEPMFIFMFVEHALMDICKGWLNLDSSTTIWLKLTMVTSMTTQSEFSIFFGAYCSVCVPHIHSTSLICKDLVGMQSTRPCSNNCSDRNLHFDGSPEWLNEERRSMFIV